MQPDNSLNLGNIGAIQIGLASPEEIRKWSHGEVTKPETINYKTHKPEPDGLFCEKIFGPKKDNECRCGKYKKGKHVGVVCGSCGVEVTTSKVRRVRMGHIELATPVAHFWFYKGIPSRMSTLLNIPQKALENVLVYKTYIMTDDQDLRIPGVEVMETSDGESLVVDENYDGEQECQVITFKKYQIVKHDVYERIVENNHGTQLKIGAGGETIKKLLDEFDLDAVAKQLRDEIADLGDDEKETTKQKKLKLSKRLDIVEMFRNSGTKPSNMMLTVLPVIPPDLRPLLQLEGGRFGTSDLTEFYRKIIYRNNTLKKQMEIKAPSIIINQQKRMLQSAVDALFENSKRAKPYTGSGNRPLKSLSDMLRGKQGRFRQNLLGKRVDYSGRSVIVVGPELKIYQCGVPKDMALELFKPFVIRKLVADYPAVQAATSSQQGFTIPTAEKAVERGEDARVWSSLEKVIKSHPVLLNRAPTLHRLGIQAFEPILVEGKALKLHPLVCTAFNADFDGDQMAIHIPLSVEAQTEARFLMMSTNNLLAPKDGKPITVPTQDMVLGSYYLTFTDFDESVYDDPDIKCFKDYNDAKRAYDLGIIKIHTPIKVRRKAVFEGEEITGLINTTIGKLIFNQAIPQDIGIIDRSKRENALTLEVNTLVKKGTLTTIIDNCIRTHGLAESATVIDDIKAQGYKYSTKGSLSISVADIEIPDIKKKWIKEAEDEVEQLRRDFEEGYSKEEDRYNATIEVWKKTTEKLTEELKAHMSHSNPIYMMSDSGARGSMQQIKQLAGMRGTMQDTSGRTIEIPIKSNFREGLNIIEFFISSHGTRKTLSDTALRTADSGYLTRRLVYASQDVVIRARDCGTHAGITYTEIANPEKPQSPIVPLADRILGRYLSDDLYDGENNLIATRDDIINEEIVAKINKAGIKRVKVRSTIECECPYGVCAKCYGTNLATNTLCNDGDVVGIIAAQSIGEPGTQLTMRTFHTGGIATADNITQGLPRVEELFEARKPKVCAQLSTCDGILKIEGETRENSNADVKVRVEPYDGDNAFSATVPYSMLEYVYDENGKIKQPAERIYSGMAVKKGDALTTGSKDPHDVMRVLGISAVESYIIEEVQKVYNSQGVKINDRHLEIIVRQMLRNVKITDAGETSLIAGNIVKKAEFDEINKQAELQGKTPAKCERLLLGITKAVIASDSFLSAASFQETTKVLSDAAITGKKDRLRGLKENVLIGKLIPAGTGLPVYDDIEVEGPVPEVIQEIRNAQKLYDEKRKEEPKPTRRADDDVEAEQAVTGADGEAYLGGGDYFDEDLKSSTNVFVDENGEIIKDDLGFEDTMLGGRYDEENSDEADFFGAENESDSDLYEKDDDELLGVSDDLGGEDE